MICCNGFMHMYAKCDKRCTVTKRIINSHNIMGALLYVHILC